MDQAQVLRVVLALLFVLVLLLALAWAARRGGWVRHASQATNLRVLGSRSLGARCSLTVVQIDDTRLLLGVTPQQITVLHSSPATADASTVPPSFADSLGKALPRP